MPADQSTPHPMVAAVDIGGTKIAVGLVNSSGQIIAQAATATQRDSGFDVGLEQIRVLLDRCLQQVTAVPLLGMGVGCTGPVDPQTGVLGPNSFLPRWEGIHTIERLQQAFNLSVAIENDADAAALGEAAWGAGKGAARFIYLTVSTGIGCGIVIDGQLYRGAGGAHPELGHIFIGPEIGPVCYCGGRGCWESLASGPALAAWYAAQRHEHNLTADPADAREICLRAAQGQSLARQAVSRQAHYLGVGLANLITTFVPDGIALGGGVMESWPLFEAQVREIISRTCRLVPYERVQLVRASLGAQTGLAGAARAWFHRFIEQSTL